MTAGPTTRRTALRLGIGGIAGALSGCTGGAGEMNSDETATTGGTTDDGGSDSLADHPAGAGLDSQPFLGPSPGAADAVIIAFEDPSCPTCRRFERETLPSLRSELVDSGHVSFVFRGLGIIYDWGEPAAKALEATLARSPDAHWALKEYYYAQQPSLGTENVLDRTRRFLADETDVDGTAVVEAVRAGDADEAYAIDIDAAEAVGVSATPTFFLFADGTYVTKAVGAVSVDVFKTALEV